MACFFKKTLLILPLILNACHLETKLDEGASVSVLTENEAQSCVYIGSVLGYSIDEFKNSKEEEMKTSALNSLKNSAAMREANAVVVKKHQSNVGKDASVWRYTIHADAYLCQ